VVGADTWEGACGVRSRGTGPPRDAVGATPLHIAFLYRRTEIGKMLMTNYPELAPTAPATCARGRGGGPHSVPRPLSRELVMTVLRF